MSVGFWETCFLDFQGLFASIRWLERVSVEAGEKKKMLISLIQSCLNNPHPYEIQMPFI